MSTSFITEWAKAQQPKAHTMKSASVFYRNLESELDVRRSQNRCYPLHLEESAIDFSSTDSLSLSSSGTLRAAFLDEVARHSNFQLSSHGSRLINGNTRYLESREREIAEFHGAESALIIANGFIANGAIFSVIPRPGDAIVYDELIHASIHDGMEDSLVLCKKSFLHNDVDSFMETLVAVRDSQPQIRNGTRCVLIAVESIYSMDGDLCPLKDLMEAAKEIFPGGNAQFIIDEAHSTGVMGPKGSGLVCALGLEKEVAIRMHTFGKALAASGAVILCNDTVRTMLLNNARGILFTVAPSFPMLAAIRATYMLLETGKTQPAQDRLQYVVKFFLKRLTSSPIWDQANDTGLLHIPIYDDDWESQAFVSQILPLRTRPKHNYFLAFHLQLAGYSVYPISFPGVAKGKDRVRIAFHAANTDAEVEALAACICDWAKEMLEIEEAGDGERLPAAAGRYYTLMVNAGLGLAS